MNFFDLNPVDLARVHWAMTRHETRVWSFADIPKRAIAGGLVVLVGVGLLIGSTIKENTTRELHPQNSVIHHGATNSKK